MGEIADRIRTVQRKIYEIGDSTDEENGPNDDILSDLSDISSLASIHLERFEISNFSSDSVSEEEKNEVKLSQNVVQPVEEKADDPEEVFPPKPHINLCPVYASPKKLPNILAPDLNSYSTATILIHKGKGYPPTKSGVRSTYVNFCFDRKLAAISSPVAYNHTDEALYRGGYNIDISNISVSDALPVVEVYDIISSEHQELVGFNAIELQHTIKTGNYATVFKDEWINIYLPHSRKNTGSIQISLFFHNGDLPVLINRVSKNDEEANIQSKKNEDKNHSVHDNDVIIESGFEDCQNDTGSSIPVKDMVTKEKKVQMCSKINEKPEMFAKETPVNVVNESKVPKAQGELKSDFQFEIDDSMLLDSLKLDIGKRFSWRTAEKLTMSKTMRYIDVDDLETEDMPNKREIETQTVKSNQIHNISLSQKSVIIDITKKQEIPIVPNEELKAETNHDMNTLDKKVLTTNENVKDIPEPSPNGGKNTNQVLFNIDGRAIDNNLPITNSVPTVPATLTKNDIDFICYSDFGFYSRKNNK